MIANDRYLSSTSTNKTIRISCQVLRLSCASLSSTRLTTSGSGSGLIFFGLCNQLEWTCGICGWGLTYGSLIVSGPFSLPQFKQTL